MMNAMRGNRKNLQTIAIIIITISIALYFVNISQQSIFAKGIIQDEAKQRNTGAISIVPMEEITTGIIIEQEIELSLLSDGGCSLLFGTYGGRDSGSITVELLDRAESEILICKTIEINKIEDCQYYNVLSDLPKSLDFDSVYRLRITSDSIESKGVTVFKTTNDTIYNCSLTINGVEQEGDLVFGSSRQTSITSTGVIIIGLAILCIILYIIHIYQKKRKNVSGIFLFSILFIIYTLRTPEDAFSSYLWAEDGYILIQGSIFQGVSTLVQPHNGAYWVIPRLVSLLCYWCIYPFNSIQALPILQGIIVRIIATLGIAYFISDKFEWLIKERYLRFIACVGMILVIPENCSDVLTCDTSLQFILNLTVFFIGLNHLCNPKWTKLSIPEVLFLMLQALSTAAAPFVAIVVGLSWLRMTMACRKNSEQNRIVLTETIKVFCICVMVGIQLLCVMGSGRVNDDYSIGQRLLMCIQCFPLFPYLQDDGDMFSRFIIFAGWLTVLNISKVNRNVIVFSVLYSFLFLFYCSMTTSLDQIAVILSGGRYVLMSYQISFLLLFLCIVRLLANQEGLAPIAVILSIALMTIFPFTYHITTVGELYSRSYDINSDAYDKTGDERLEITIGPWDHTMIIPIDIKSKQIDDMATGEITMIDGQQYGSDIKDIFDYSHTVLIDGWTCANNHDTISHVYIQGPDGKYLAPVDLIERPEKKYAFSFRINSETIKSLGYNIVFICETSDRNYHKWKETNLSYVAE